MKQSASALIEDLITRTKEVLNAIEEFKMLPEATLNWRAAAESWSILENIEHLNLYGDFYLPEMQRRIQAAPKRQGDYTFKSGVFGNYFAEAMLPKEKLNSMKTFKDKNPLGSQLDKSVLDRFVQQEKTMLDILQQARQIDLVKTKSATTLPVIKFRLGDTFRFVIYHHQRHIVQAQKVLETMRVNTQ